MRHLLAAAVLGLLLLAPGAMVAAADGAVRIEAVVWQLSRDYPEGSAPDVDLPLRAVYLKTHDGTDWMATYDHHPLAIDGPARIRELTGIYAAQGIDVFAWFVPKGRDAEAQLRMAEEVLDTGVKGLYADVEAFSGFCEEDCWYLAENFWARLRAERPSAQLGVIYDPRPQWWEPSAVRAWLAQADVALPMCFWETYSGQRPWDDPGGCVIQAHEDLAQLTPGRHLEYVPMLQGDSTSGRFAPAVHASAAMGATRVSVWRRGVVPAEIWDWLRVYPTVPAPCWVSWLDGCLVRESSSADVYLLEGGGRFLVTDLESVRTLGLDPASLQVAPDGFLSLRPSGPPDGVLLREAGDQRVWVVYGGARFWVPDPEMFGVMGFRWEDIREIVPGMLAQVPLIPRAYTRLQELADPAEWVIVGGHRLRLDQEMREILLASGRGQPLYSVPDGALAQVPVAGPLLGGDVTCDGSTDAADALQILRRAAGLPNLGICAVKAGDVDCSARVDAADALVVLRHTAGLAVTLPQGCGGPGQPFAP